MAEFNFKKNIKCNNCELKNTRLTKGYCNQCYRFYLKISKLKKNQDVYSVTRGHNNYTKKEKMAMFNECIRQLEIRLQDIKDANILRKNVTAHQLEDQINSTIRSFGKKGFNGRYGLGKINDYLEFYTRNKPQKEFIFQLFAKIKLLNKFKLDRWKVFEAKNKI